jgi:chaperonin GroES
MNKSGLKPLGHAVLLQPYAVEEMTKGGLILPSQIRERDQMAEQRAVVVEIGAAAWEDERAPRCLSGDRVMFSKFAGYATVGPADGQSYRVVNDRDIFLAIVKEKEDE